MDSHPSVRKSTLVEKELDRMDAYLAERNFSYVIDETDELKLLLEKALAESKTDLTDQKIKELSHKYIEALESYLLRGEEFLNQEEIPSFE